MKLLVEFESKEEMDTFFAASEVGAIAPPRALYLVNKLGQTASIKMTTKADEPDAAVVEIHQRGTPDADVFAGEAALKLL